MLFGECSKSWSHIWSEEYLTFLFPVAGPPTPFFILVHMTFRDLNQLHILTTSCHAGCQGHNQGQGEDLHVLPLSLSMTPTEQ